ncbi:NADPH-dependent FMN reductase [Arthrobacter sp. SO3]|uniref:NADPH-dependent FMN reductase n=1 Tax=Arthrobacter sp. SO3 TaxID=1897057 RepID=UPI00299D9C41|nr:NAD(P)H-dependent oxidoreductase [Arthrobacter sp. SO3]
MGRGCGPLRRLHLRDRRVQPPIPASLKNALDFLYGEWNNKAAAFVSYGSGGGIRAVEHLRQVAGELQMADVRAQVALTLATEFENYRTFTPSDKAERALGILFDQVIAWSDALRALRPRPDLPPGT